jgi:predicted nucleic acid-binding protein
VNVIDSSAWIAYFVDQPAAEHFIEPLQRSGEVAVPTVVLHEVFKFLLRNHSKRVALSAAARMRNGLLVPLDSTLALHAAECGIELKLPLADSIIYATARSLDATLWTLDADFEGLPGVKYFPGNT